MQVQVHTDATIQGGESLESWVREEVNTKLARLKEHVVRVEVFLTGVDAIKTTGAPGKKCVLETRANGRQPVAVNAEAEKVKDAFNAALEKLRRTVESDLDKVRDKSIRDSVRGVDDPALDAEV
ncbi:MAG: HPF/RaiA family ribosome-associated protein [Comamonas sp.]|nr:HPF/RaiA family ribosome-associated protein [Candidatus Comamonas equi]